MNPLRLNDLSIVMSWVKRELGKFWVKIIYRALFLSDPTSSTSSNFE